MDRYTEILIYFVWKTLYLWTSSRIAFPLIVTPVRTAGVRMLLKTEWFLLKAKQYGSFPLWVSINALNLLISSLMV